MSISYWHRQTSNKPLFPELEWSRPENKMYAGKLLVIGGNLHGFSAPAQAFNEAEKAGIGYTRIVLPDAIRKTVQHFIPEAEFAPTTPSGSFASSSLDTLIDNASWADGILLAGDFGRNSETAIVLESFMQKHTGKVILTKDALDYFVDNAAAIINREETLLVTTLAQLQKIAMHVKFTTAFTYNMDLVRLVEALHIFTSSYPVHIILQHQQVKIVATNGSISTTQLTDPQEIWRLHAAAQAAVWWIQHPPKTFEALTSSCLK